MKLQIEITGDSESDIELALAEVTRLISEGFTSGGNSNDTGAFTFSVSVGEP